MRDHSSSRSSRLSFMHLELHTEIKINASDQDVWRVLTDFAAYHFWNEAIPEMQGSASPGSILTARIRWPGLKDSPYKLKVLRATPRRELRWLGHFGVPGLLDGNHAFLIQPLANYSCIVIQKENFSGWLVPLFARWLRRNVLLGFEQMNEGLKRRVEASQ